jgi:hypothetical protein
MRRYNDEQLTQRAYARRWGYSCRGWLRLVAQSISAQDRHLDARVEGAVHAARMAARYALRSQGDVR